LVDEAPEENSSTPFQEWNQKILGETPEAVKPCLEGIAHDRKEKTSCYEGAK
jgi:hypothetical protein